VGIEETIREQDRRIGSVEGATRFDVARHVSVARELLGLEAHKWCDRLALALDLLIALRHEGGGLEIALEGSDANREAARIAARPRRCLRELGELGRIERLAS
jgi:hypothetical protein